MLIEWIEPHKNCQLTHRNENKRTKKTEPGERKKNH